MTASVHIGGGLDWSAIALLATAAAAIWSLRQNAAAVRNSVRPVLWIEAAFLTAHDVLEVRMQNMGQGPVANLKVSVWLVPTDHPYSIAEQEDFKRKRWKRLRERPATITFGRPMAANSRTVSKRQIFFPSGDRFDLYLGIYEVEVMDVHGHVHRGVERRWEWRRGWPFVRKPPGLPGSMMVPREDYRPEDTNNAGPTQHDIRERAET